MSETGFIIFSGYNQRAVIALCRTLEYYSLPFYIIALSPEDTIFLSSYQRNIGAVRGSTKLDIEDLGRCIKRIIEASKHKKYIIAPSSESMNLLFLRNQECIQEFKCVIPLVYLEQYKQISEKYRFCRLCDKYSISIPKEIDINSEFNYPIVAKPVSDIAKDGRRLYPQIIKNSEEYNLFLKDNNPDEHFFQEYIRGMSYYLLYYFYRNGNIDKLSQRNLIQQGGGKSIVAAESSSLHNKKEYEYFDKMLKDINFYGLIMIEIKVKDSTFYMIEANPRMWGPSQLMLDAGKNLFVSMINDYCDLDLSINSKRINKKALYFWAGGFFSSFGEKDLTWYCEKSYFARNIREFFQSEIYGRNDTVGIFNSEVAQSLSTKAL